MNANLSERLAELPDFLAGHLLLSVAAIVVGVAISLPLGVFAASRPAVSVWTLNIASVIQTIPGLALLALMVPLLGGTIGYAPAFLALMLYSILPVLRNAIVGLQGVDPAVREAARGVGMTGAQRLWRIELPLALPIIVAGLRTSAVWVVGAATLATPVGATSLGNYIFAGLQTRNWLSVIFGCIFAAGLAIALDQMIRLWEIAARERRRGLALGVGAGLAVMVVAALIAPAISWNAAQGPRVAQSETGAAGGVAGRRVLIGAKAFSEQYILAELIERRLAAAGAAPERLDNLGSAIVFDALTNNEIDVSIDYTGTIWATVMNRTEPIDRYSMFVEIVAYLRERHGVLVLGRLGFENAYGFAMQREQAEALGIESLTDLAAHAGELSFGGDPEFFSRAEWIRSRDSYGLGAAQTRAMDSTFMYGAVRDGEVDVIGAYTTDGRIAAYDLVVLTDPLGALPPYDAMIMLSPEAAATPGLADALAPLIGAIDSATMREANKRVDLDRETPGQVGEWLDGELAQD